MVYWNQDQVIAHELRLRAQKAAGKPAAEQQLADHEVRQIHEPIIQWCEKQFPQVPYIHARTDVPSTIAEGAPDFVVFYRGKALLLEPKSKTGKVKPAQLAWHLLAEKQGFTVHVIRSYEEFLQIISTL